MVDFPSGMTSMMILKVLENIYALEKRGYFIQVQVDDINGGEEGKVGRPQLLVHTRNNTTSY